MPKLSRAEREEIARRRIVSVLRTQGVVNSRTLEQKIADAGPSHLRIQPHILTGVRAQMEKEGRVVTIGGTDARWLHLDDESGARVAARHAELSAVWADFSGKPVRMRTGQALEIAVFRSLVASQGIKTFGGFVDLSNPSGTGLYSKNEIHTLNGRSLGKEALDFIVQAGGEECGVEVKNVREWLYPNRSEIRDAVRKALHLGTIPVIIARRIPYVTFRLMATCGVLLHQNYNQLMAHTDAAVAARAAHRELLGYHDIRVGDQPDARLATFIGKNLPALAPQARARLNAFGDLLERFALGDDMSYAEFAARVRRRENGEKEESDWPDDPNDIEY